MTRRNVGVKLSGDRNECPGCGELFNSTRAFDVHRIGKFGKPVPEGGRRCSTVAEMMQSGMAKNAAGFWVTSANPKFAHSSHAGKANSDFSGQEASTQPVSISAAPSAPNAALNPHAAWPFPDRKS
jgi:hypothetical protein